jgi:polyhydroxybutyrate depolymerase
MPILTAQRIHFAILVILAAAAMVAVVLIIHRPDSPRGAVVPETPRAAALPPGDHQRELLIGDRRRTYLLHVPPLPAPDRGLPLVLAFHPGLSWGKRFAQVTGMSDAADSAGFAVAYPDAYRRAWNAGDCCGPAQREGVDDVAFAEALIDDVNGALGIDPDRVFAAGFSNGGAFAYRLACEKSDRIVAVAVVAAALRLPVGTCRPARPVSVLHIHGLADPVAPFDGGVGVVAENGESPPVRDTIATFVAANGCSGQPRTEHPSAKVTVTTYSGCRSSTTVELYTIADMGHAWPGATSAALGRFGPQSSEVEATTTALRFFHAHPRRD